MSDFLDLSVIVLTYNEEIHLSRCIESVKPITNNIFIVDSFSTDGTLKIAEELGAQVLQNPWENNYSKQFNWALENCPITTKWILRLDADEYLTEELQSELQARLPKLEKNINGVIFPLKRMFLGRQIKHSTGTVKLLRLFKTGKARSESRWMDEHITLTDGEAIEFSGHFVDDNLNNLSWWTTKHVGYAVREAVDILDIELGLLNLNNEHVKISEEASKKRDLKRRYAKQPLFFRAFVYFIYRYFFKLGFLDGKEGFLWNFLQGWWYRTLVDVKIYEIKKACGTDKDKIKEYLKKHHNIDISISSKN